MLEKEGMALELVWLDTDIGSDIDDSLCLNYLLKRKDCKVAGITTVGGNALDRAKVADCMCKLEKKAIPIYVGSENPLMGKQLQTKCQQAEFLDMYSHDENFGDLGQGLKALRHCVVENPKQVTLLGIGAVTNIALLISLYPEVKPLLKEVVLMIGRFQHSDSLAHHTPICEWNCLCDPLAAKIVFNAGLPNLKCLSLDVSHAMLKPSAWVREVFNTDGMRPVFDYFEKWEKDRGEIIFYDPVAAVCIFEPQLMEWYEDRIDVLTENTPLIGLTYSNKESSAVKITKSVYSEKIFEHFKTVMER